MKKKPAKQAPSIAQLTAGEEALRRVQKAIEGKEFASLDDLNAYLSTISGSLMKKMPEDAELSAKDKAQELAYDAMAAESEAEARKLVKRALQLDPDCVDALVLLTSLDARSAKDAIAGLQKAIDAGERSLGARFIKENKGHFWGILHTRPYMRALAETASLLRGEGLRSEAIAIYEKMLDLNPNDNQGVRDALLGLYLAVGDLAAVGKLLKKYKEDSMANFAWGRVLERYLSGDLPGAAAALKKARAANGFVELYLSARKPIPKVMPEMYSPGSEEEAILCMEILAAAWVEHKDALFWLLEQCRAQGANVIPIPSPEKKVSRPRKKPQ
ncbi:MAG: tetratricopeptide repeat protein [Terracidiphilus sp.]